MKQILKKYQSGPHQQGTYHYYFEIEDGTTLKDFMKYVLNDNFKFADVNVTLTDPKLRDVEYLSSSEKQMMLKIDLVNNVIKSISHYDAYNMFQDVEIDTTKHNEMIDTQGYVSYFITLKNTKTI